MSWFDEFKDRLFDRKVEETDFNSIFARLDVDEFFKRLNNLWHPSELIAKLGGIQKLENLYKDPDIYAAVDKRIAALLDTRMVIDGENALYKEFFEKNLRPFERQLKQDFWWTVYNGYGVEQIIYDEDLSGNVIGFQREEFWRFEPQKDLIHLKLVHTSNNEFRNKLVPYGKWVLTTNNGTSYNPIGDAMAERLITPWIFKCTGWDLWIDFAKRFANGFMHAQIDDMSKKDEVRKALESSGKSSVLVTDKNSSMTMIQASRDSSLYDLIDSKTVRAIQKVILGETQTSDMAERGSSASAGVHNDVRLEKTRADIELVTTALNDVIRHIADVNGFDIKQLPKASLIYDPGLNAELATRDTTLVNQGVEFNKDYYIATYGIDPKYFEVVKKPAQPSFGFGASGKKAFLSADDMRNFIGQPKTLEHKCNLHNFDAASARKGAQGETEREDIVAVMSRNSAPPLDPQDVVSAILTSENRAQLEEKLNALFDTRNNSFVDDLTTGLYYSAALGARMGNPEKLENEEK